MENDNIQIIIKRIKERREELELSYMDLSKMTGIPKSTLQRYESSFIKKIPVQKMEIIAKALNVTPGFLMGWEENPNRRKAEFDTEYQKTVDKVNARLTANYKEGNPITDADIILTVYGKLNSKHKQRLINLAYLLLEEENQ